MEEIETFVRRLCAEGDLSVLTKKLIRTQYQAHYGKQTVTKEEKDKINEVLETVIQELAEQSQKAKARKRKMSSSSSDEDAQPLKKRPTPSSKRSDEDASDSSDADFEEQQPVKRKKSRKKKVLEESSADEDETPLKPKPGAGKIHDTAGSCSDEATPVKVKSTAGSRKTRLQLESSDEDNTPLKSQSTLSKSEDDWKEDSEKEVPSEEDSDDDAVPLKRKTSPKVPKTVSESSEDSNSPAKVNSKQSRPGDLEQDSELDTSSLSSDGENDVPEQVPQRTGPNIKYTKKKPQHAELSEKSANQKTNSKKAQKGAASNSDKEETPYLKRLRVICRKVGIFVRNDIHFVGCTTDAQKIERLKEALRKAGMKGQPSLSKVDSVNLRREAEALDTTNIIETQGRPRRQAKDVFTRTDSPKKLLTPIKQQFSRIKDLISDSESE